MGQLIQTLTPDGLSLQGYYSSSSDKKIAVLHIHGFEGNFYGNKFIFEFIDTFERENVGFLTVNTRGHDIGSRNELLEEAHLDITAWLKVLVNEGYEEIVLQGHSGGTVKVVRYLFEGELKDKVSKLVLLAPIDPKGFRTAKGRGDLEDFLAKAQAKVDEGKGDELITPDFDHDVLSYKTFISWYRQDDLGRCFEFCSPDYDFPVLRKITIPTKIISGSNDEYLHPSNPEHPEEAMNILLKYVPHSNGLIIDGATHFFSPNEDEMVKRAVTFIKEGI